MDDRARAHGRRAGAMSVRPRCLALATLIALASCDERNDPARIVEPDPEIPSTTPPRFQLLAELRVDPRASDGPPVWRLEAALDAGREDGEPRPANDTLWIDGEPLLPERVNIPYRYYRLEESVDPARAQERVIRVQPPTVGGVSPDEISFAFVGRSGGDTISREPGGDLVIPILAPAAAPDPSPSRTTWEVRIHSSETALVRLAGYDVPRGQLLIPSPYLPPAESVGAVFFTIRFEGRRESQPGEDEYVSGYRVVSDFAWSLASGS